MLPNKVGEITNPAHDVISILTSKPLIVVAFDQSWPSAQGLPIVEFTRRFTPPTFVDVGEVNGEFKGAMLGVTLSKLKEAKWTPAALKWMLAAAL